MISSQSMIVLNNLKMKQLYYMLLCKQYYIIEFFYIYNHNSLFKTKALFAIIM